MIQSITIDGKHGLFSLFTDIPVQMCLFHQQAIVTRYLTRKPKMQASIGLKRITGYLGSVSEQKFVLLLDCWYERHKEFLLEKIYSEKTGKWHYTHRRIRSAFKSLKSNLPYLFTYKKYPDLNIPSTTPML